MDFKNELTTLYDKSVSGSVILESASKKVVYVDGLYEADSENLVGEFGDEVFSWVSDCPELTNVGETVAWEKIDSDAGKYYRIESTPFEKEGGKYELHKLLDITEYMRLNRDITKYISFFKKLAKFQSAVLEKLSDSYYDLLPMLSDYYVTNKVYFVLQHDDYLDITTYTRVQKQFSNENVTFLFLSTDTDRNAWQNALREDSGSMTDSYRILDLDTPFIKELQLRAIPRYLIIDASGQLVDVDAERPSSKGIAKTLSALL